MSSDRNPRIANAIHSLIDHLVPSESHDDKDSADERHDACFQLVRSIFEQCGFPMPFHAFYLFIYVYLFD